MCGTRISFLLSLCLVLTLLLLLLLRDTSLRQGRWTGFFHQEEVFYKGGN